MAKRIQVGGRIESKEVGGIVTGAAEILDDAKGKKQSVINDETDDELLRLDQSKQDNLTFDNAPTEGSDNPVKSGGLYTAQQAILLAIAAINELIPSAASALNQLADKAFVNSSISTNTATFRGTSAAGLNEQQFLAWANGLTHDLNDYVFWQTSDAAGNTLFKRYKWNGTEWAYEYTLNNSTFTAEQWEAIQSGITALLVAKLRALPTAQELIQSFDSKQDVLTFDNVPTLGSNNPVKSSGIYNVIKAITDLIPAEATAQNQLADKADVAAKIVAAIPSWKGQYDALTDLQAVTGAKAGDMGCVKTTDSDGHAVLTFYQYSAQSAWVVYYTLRHYAQNKPATTGTTGDYPYNGMGRIELQKNIVNGVNTLTQAMLTQQNTIYVIQYNFTLGEDITIPADCVLEFDGGSISGEHTLTGTNAGIKAGFVKIFNTNVVFAGTWNIVEVYPEWFGAKGDGVTDDTLAMSVCLNSIISNLIILRKTYYITSSIADTESFGFPCYLSITRNNLTIKGNGTLKFEPSVNQVIGIMLSGTSNILFEHIHFTSECIYNTDRFESTTLTSNVNALCYNNINGLKCDDCKWSNVWSCVYCDHVIGITGVSTNVLLIDCNMTENCLMPIGISYTENFVLENSKVSVQDGANSKFHHIYGNCNNKNHIIKNCIFNSAAKVACLHYSSSLDTDDYPVDTLRVVGCVFLNTNSAVYLSNNTVSTIYATAYIENCYFENVKYACSAINRALVFMSNCSMEDGEGVYEGQTNYATITIRNCNFNKLLRFPLSDEGASVDMFDCYINISKANRTQYNTYSGTVYYNGFHNCIFDLNGNAPMAVFSVKVNSPTTFTGCVFNFGITSSDPIVTTDVSGNRLRFVDCRVFNRSTIFTQEQIQGNYIETNEDNKLYSIRIYG